MELVVRPHVLSDRDMQVLHAEPGRTLKELFDAVEMPVEYRIHACIFVHGTLVPRDYWERVRPKAGTHVLIATMVHGGGSGKKILAFVAAIALSMVVGPLAAKLMSYTTLTGTALSIATAAVKVGIMVVGSLALNAIFAPPKIGQNKSGDMTRSDAYSFTGQSNSIRPYEPMMRVYGQHRVMADIAANPYTVTVGDTVYFMAIYSFGYAPLALEDFKIGETPITGFAEPPEIYIHESFTAGDELKLYKNDVWQDALSLDITLASPATVTTRPLTEYAIIDVLFPSGLGYYNDGGGVDKRSTTMLIEYAPDGSSSWVQIPTVGGNEVRLSHGYVGGFSQFYFAVPYTVEYGYNGDTYSYYLEAGTTVLNGITWPDGIPAVGAVVNLGPYRMIVASADSSSVTFTAGIPGRIAFQGDSGTAEYMVPTSNRVWTVEEATGSGFIAGITVNFPSAGTWKVRITKTDADPTSTRYQWKRYVSALRSFKSVAPIAPDVPTTIVELRMKATGQLNGTVEEFSALATSKLRIWDGLAFSEPLPTRNPAWAYLDILTGTANSRPVPLDRIDLTQLLTWAIYCGSVRSGFTGVNATLDCVLRGESTLWEVMQSIASVGRAAPALKDNKYSVIIDNDTRTPVQMFTPRNSWGFGSSKTFMEQPHGLRLKWVDPAISYKDALLTVYNSGYNAANATTFEEVQTFGMTRPEQVTRYGRYLLAQAALRQEKFSISTDIENIVATRGDLVLIQHDVLQVGGASSRILSIVSDTVTLDAPIQPFTAPYGVRIRKSNGVITSLLAATVSGASSFTISSGLTSGCAAGDMIIYGSTATVTGSYVVKSVRPSKDLTATISFEEYAPGVLTAEDGTIPPYVPQGGSSFVPAAVEALIGSVIQRVENVYTYGSVLLQWRQPSSVEAVPSFYAVYFDDGVGNLTNIGNPTGTSFVVPTEFELWKIETGGVYKIYHVIPHWYGDQVGGDTNISVLIPQVTLLAPANYDTFVASALSDGTRSFAFEYTTTPVPVGLEGAVIRFAYYGTGSFGTETFDALAPLNEGVLTSSPVETRAGLSGNYRFGIKARANGVLSSTALYSNVTMPELSEVFGISISSDSIIFKQDATGTPVNTTITLTALMNSAFTGTVTWSQSGGYSGTIPSGSNTWVLNAADQTGEQVTYTATKTVGAVTYTDAITIYRVRDGAEQIVIGLTNPVMMVPATDAGVVTTFTPQTTELRVYYGGGLADDSLLVYTIVSDPSGLVPALTVAITGVYTLTFPASPTGWWTSSTPSATVRLRAALASDALAYREIDLVVQKAISGTPAQSLRINASATTLSYDTAGNAYPAAQSITMDLVRIPVALAGASVWVATGYDSFGVSQGTVTLTGSGDTRVLTSDNFLKRDTVFDNDIQYVHVVVTVGALTVTQGVIRITDGQEAILSFLTKAAAVLPATSAGVVSDYTASTHSASTPQEFRIYQGAAQVTSGITYSVQAVTGATHLNGVAVAAGMAGVINASTGQFNITASTGWTGSAISITFRAAVTANPALYREAVFTMTKSTAGSDGADGDPGADAVVYEIVPSVNSVSESVAGVMAPATVTYSFYSKTGSAARVAYSGRVIIETSNDHGAGWSIIYTSSTNETSKAFTVPSSITTMRARLHLAGGTTTQVTQITVPVIPDGATGTPGTPGTPGASAITVENSVPAVVLRADASGATLAGAYASSGTILIVREGATALTFKTTIDGDSQFSIGTPTVSAGSITVGERTGQNTTSAVVADHSSMGTGTDSLVITYPISYRRSNSTTGVIYATQSVAKVRGAMRTAIVILYKWAASPPTPPSGTFSYTWETGAFTLPSSNDAGWQATPTGSSPGYTLYSIQQFIVNYGSEVTTTGITWSSTTVGIAGGSGSNGSAGARGTVTRYQTATANWNGITSTYVDTTTKNIVDLFPSSTVIAGDYVTIKGPTAVMTKYYNGSAWVDPGQFIDGNLFVAGTITADKIDSRGLSILDANGRVILQSGISFLGGESLIDIPTLTLTGGWEDDAVIYLRAGNNNSTGHAIAPGDVLTFSADIAADSTALANGHVAHLVMYAENSGNGWHGASTAFINGTTSVNTRKSATFVVPADVSYNWAISLRLFHSIPDGSSGGPYTGTVTATNVMIERGLVATTYKKATVSAINRINSSNYSTYIDSLSANAITTGSLSAKRIDGGDDNVAVGTTFALNRALSLPNVGGSGTITAAGAFRTSALSFGVVGINATPTEGYGVIAVRQGSGGAAYASWGNWNGVTGSAKTITSSGLISMDGTGASFAAYNTAGATEATNYVTTTATLAKGTTAATAIGLELLNYNAVGVLAATSRYGVGVSSVWYAVDSDAVIKTTNGSASTNTTTGALLVTGGAGIGGNINAGGNIAATGTLAGTSLALSSTTESSDPTTGALTVVGGIGTGKSISFGSAGAAKSSGGFRHDADEFGALRLVTKRPSNTYDRFITRVHVVQTDPASMILEHAKYDSGGGYLSTDTVYLNLHYSSKFYALYSPLGKIALIASDNSHVMLEITGSATFSGTINVNGTTLPFTGSHDGFTADTPEEGDIVVDDVCLLHKDIYNTVFKVEASTTVNQKSAIGVCAFVAPEAPERFGENEEFYIDPLVLDGLKYIVFNSIGEGQVNVCGENGDLEKGDLIVTSSIPGKGMRQSDDFVRSYTVARARESVSFASPTEVKMVACVYLCG